MWIKDKVNDCYKMSHSHLITIEKVNRHYILYFRDIKIKSFPTLTAAKQYGDFFQLDSHTRYAIYLIHNFGNCTGNNLGYYTGTIGLHGDIYVPGHVPTINGEVKLYKTFARAKQGAQAIYNKCGYVQKFEIHTVEIRSNDKVEANNRVEAEEKAKEYVDKYQADKFFECATNRVFKIIPKT